MKKRVVSFSISRELDADDLTNMANALIELEILLRDSAYKVGYISSHTKDAAPLNLDDLN